MGTHGNETAASMSGSVIVPTHLWHVRFSSRDTSGGERLPQLYCNDLAVGLRSVPRAIPWPTDGDPGSVPDAEAAGRIAARQCTAAGQGVPYLG